jgi:hypothetical protein
MHMCKTPDWIHTIVHKDLRLGQADGPGLGLGPDRAWDRPRTVTALGPGPGSSLAQAQVLAGFMHICIIWTAYTHKYNWVLCTCAFSQFIQLGFMHTRVFP